MYLHEYQSKQYFARYGIPTLQGKTADSQQDAFAVASEFGVPVVINAQALANQRVFRLANTPKEAEYIAQDILAMTLQGVRVHTLLIEPAAEVAAEYFLGLYADRGSSLLMFASTEGGSEISQIEHSHRDRLAREVVNPLLGVFEFQARNLANGINLPREHWNAFTRIAQNLYRCLVACDAVRAEINPLALTQGGELIALGGKLEIDDNALFRQPELAAIRDVKAENETLVQARAAGISYVRLSGSIGCIVSGAGLGMATIDLLARHTESASSLLDLGSEIQRAKISAALSLVLPDSRAVLFNIFADKSTCDSIATELVAALEEQPPAVPVVIRLAGQNAEEGHALLTAAHLTIAESSTEAVQLITGSVHVDTG